HPPARTSTRVVTGASRRELRLIFTPLLVNLSAADLLSPRIFRRPPRLTERSFSSSTHGIYSFPRRRNPCPALSVAVDFCIVHSHPPQCSRCRKESGRPPKKP